MTNDRKQSGEAVGTEPWVGRLRKAKANGDPECDEWKRYADAGLEQYVRYEASEALVAGMREALLTLTNSADGLSFAEHEIRAVVGNTNWNVLRLHIDEARAALSRFDTSKERS